MLELQGTTFQPDAVRVEACGSINTADLRRWGLLTPGHHFGAQTWGRGASESSVGYEAEVGETAGVLRVGYELVPSGERLEYAVRLVTTPCHFGRVRWWFVCPLSLDEVACGRRVRRVYLSSRYFGCRHCHDMTSRSTQESDRRVYAAAGGGLDPDRLGEPTPMSIRQFGFALRVFRHEQRKLDRLDRRLGL